MSRFNELADLMQEIHSILLKHLLRIRYLFIIDKINRRPDDLF